MKNWFIRSLVCIPLVCISALAQSPAPQRGTYGPKPQGTVFAIPNTAGSQAASFEYVFDVTPAAVSITIQGCMRGSGPPGNQGTCDTAVDTYTGTSNSVRAPTFTKVYDTFLITIGTLSAGTNLTVNTTVVVSKAGTSSGGGGSGTISSGTTNTLAKYTAATTLGNSNVTENNGVVTITAAGVNGQLGLSGSTSGTATFTAPAVAGTSTNAVTMSNVLQGPNGTGTNPTYSFTNGPGSGMGFTSSNSGTVFFNGAGIQLSAGNGPTIANNFNLMWATGSVDQGQIATIDTALNRVAAGIVGVGTTNGASTTGSIAAASFQSRGTTFTASGCANSTLVGGATAGKYTSVTGGACTVTITMGNSATAPNGWVCDAHDLTTVADANNVTLGSSTTTTANLVEGTVAANDVIAFKCTGY